MFERIKEDVNCVFERDPAARTAFEVWTNYPGFHAILLHRASYSLWQSDWKWLARSLSTFSRWLTGVEIHPGAKIGRRFFIDHGMGVVIGETAELGDDVTLYHGVTLGGTTWRAGKRHPTLKDGVVVGAGAKVLGPITVGEGARIGSNAVVAKDVPACATAIGIPGRIILKDDKDAQRRQAMSEKIGFDAYGVSGDMPDPIAKSVHAILDHMHAVDDKIEGMCEALASLGSNYCNEQLPELNIEEIDLVEPEVQDKEKQE